MLRPRTARVRRLSPPQQQVRWAPAERHDITVASKCFAVRTLKATAHAAPAATLQANGLLYELSRWVHPGQFGELLHCYPLMKLLSSCWSEGYEALHYEDTFHMMRQRLRPLPRAWHVML
jgi:hypothetical protein